MGIVFGEGDTENDIVGSVIPVRGRRNVLGSLNATINARTVNKVLTAMDVAAAANNVSVIDPDATFVIEPDGEGEIKKMTFSVQRAALQALAKNGASLTIIVGETGFAVELDKQAVAEIAASLRGTLRVTVNPITNPTHAARRAVGGDMPIYSIEMRDTSGNRPLISLEEGRFVMGLVYELAEDENPDGLYIIKIVDGQLVRIEAEYEDGWLKWLDDSGGFYAIGNE